MITDLQDLRDARDWAIHKHRPWKQRLTANDLVAGGQWQTVWDDLAAETLDPLVENVYLEAISDKSQAADATEPLIIVGPTTGTRRDRGEKNAQDKRRVFVSYGQYSRLGKKKVQWFMDWWQAGAAYSLPWANWRMTPRHPYFMRIDPRHVYPLAHDGLGNLTAGFFVKSRRAIDVKNEWGKDHPAFVQVQNNVGGFDDDHPLEEVWWFDTERWSVALYNNNEDLSTQYFRYVSPANRLPATATKAAWLAHPTAHNLSRCPLVENKAESFDGEYRGPLDVMVPGLKTAQHIMARILEDVQLNIYSPTLFDNVLNPEDYGPNAQLIGDGTGTATVTPVRAPINFEAQQLVEQAVEGSRRVGKFPIQRSGEPGASIVSAKGTNALLGSFNTEMAQAQRDMAFFLAETLSVTAEFDETWCSTRKKVEGFDQGEMYDLTYDPSSLFKGDHRVWVNYGGSLGLDDTTYLIRLMTMFQNNGMARRSLMQKSGMIDNVLQEETERTIDAIVDGFLGFMMQQASEGGNLEPLLKLVEEIDGDDVTARAGIMNVIKSLTRAVPAGAPAGGGAGSPDAILQARSMASEGLPSSDGQTQVRNSLAQVLPPRIRRAIGEAAPGGTAT